MMEFFETRLGKICQKFSRTWEADFKKMRTYNNFEFIKHDQITFKDLWKNDTHLAGSGKVFLARNFIERAIFFYQGRSQNPEIATLAKFK